MASGRRYSDIIMAAKEEIERTYGDVPTYLEKGLDLTTQDIEQLQSILLE